jgi:hypothetical protein
LGVQPTGAIVDREVTRSCLSPLQFNSGLIAGYAGCRQRVVGGPMAYTGDFLSGKVPEFLLGCQACEAFSNCTGFPQVDKIEWRHYALRSLEAGA